MGILFLLILIPGICAISDLHCAKVYQKRCKQNYNELFDRYRRNEITFAELDKLHEQYREKIMPLRYRLSRRLFKK